MFLRVKSKWRNIYWRKSTKIQSGKLWCFNLDRSLPPSSKLSKTKTPFQTIEAKNIGLPLPSSQLEGAPSLEELNISVSYPARCYLLLSDCSWGVETPFFQPAPTHRTEALLPGQCTENTRLMVLPLAHTVVFQQQERQTKRNPDHCLPSIKYSDPTACVSFREKIDIVPTSSSRTLIKRFFLGGN